MLRTWSEKRWRRAADAELKAACIFWGYADVQPVEAGLKLDLTGEA
ncbi:MAG: hypothetical protein ABSD11_12485 [Methylocella sp.]|jgi:hypothetical protein